MVIILALESISGNWLGKTSQSYGARSDGTTAERWCLYHNNGSLSNYIIHG